MVVSSIDDVDCVEVIGDVVIDWSDDVVITPVVDILVLVKVEDESFEDKSVEYVVVSSIDDVNICILVIKLLDCVEVGALDVVDDVIAEVVIDWTDKTNK